MFDKLRTLVAELDRHRTRPAVLLVDEALRLAGHQQIAVLERPEDYVVFELEHLGRLVQLISQLQRVGGDFSHVVAGPSDASKV